MAREPLSLTPTMSVSIDDAIEVILGDRCLSLHPSARQALATTHQQLEEMRSAGALLYGVTTGFGPLASQAVDSDSGKTLQKNLIYHLSSGTGQPMEPHWVLAMLFCRILSLSRGHSAMSEDTLDRLIQCFNARLIPEVPRYGTVGASGDLTPLAHAMLAMMGEGRFLVDGRPTPGRDILSAHGIAPIELGDRDGLAFVNGTAAMTGLAVLASHRARRFQRWSIALGALFAECMGARRQAFNALLANLRNQEGQRRVTAELSHWLDGSRRLTAPNEPRPSLGHGRSPVLQDPYTIRCIPQMLGAIDDALEYHATLVGRELNGVTDNPVFIHDGEPQALHGGNFFGHPVALSSDHLNQALISLAVLQERQIARICDDSKSPFPAFLQPHQPGIQSGFMGAQVAASSLVAQLRSLATPLAIQSMPTNADNQDVNPMGTLAALRSHEILDRLSEITAILAAAIIQARSLQDDDCHQDYAPRTRALARGLEKHFDALEEDRPLSDDLNQLGDFLESNDPDDFI